MDLETLRSARLKEVTIHVPGLESDVTISGKFVSVDGLIRRPGLTLFHVIRRPGWNLCVADAADIEISMKELRSRGVDIDHIGITFQTIRIIDFQSMSNWSGQLFMDETQAFIKYLGSRQQDLSELDNPEIMAAMRKAGKYASDRGFTQNLDGAGMLLGGAIVLDKDANIIYEWQEKRWGDKIDTAQLLEACIKVQVRSLL